MSAVDFVFFYQGEPIMLSTSPAGGFEFDCPKCKNNGWLEPHPTEGHAVWKNVHGNVCVEPSIVCECGLHIVIENGVARDV